MKNLIDFLPLTMTREEFERTDFMKMTFNYLHKFNAELESKYGSDGYNKRYDLKYKITIVGQEDSPFDYDISIDKLVYMAMEADYVA